MLPGSPHFPAPLRTQMTQIILLKRHLSGTHAGLCVSSVGGNKVSPAGFKTRANTQYQHPLPFPEATSHLLCSPPTTLHTLAPKSRPAPAEIFAIGLPGMWLEEEGKREEGANRKQEMQRLSRKQLLLSRPAARKYLGDVFKYLKDKWWSFFFKEMIKGIFLSSKSSFKC